MKNSPGTNLFAPLDEHVNIALTSEDFGNGHLAVFANCNDDPNTVALQLDTYANGCAILRTDLGSGNNVYYMTGTTDSPSWTLLTPGGGGGGVGGTIGMNQVAFGVGLNNIGGNNEFNWNNSTNTLTVLDGASNNMLSLNGGIGVYTLGGLNDISLTVNGPDHQIIGNGFYHSIRSSIVFTGGGLNDLSLASGFTGPAATSYDVTVVAVNNISITYTGLTGGAFTDGDTITQTTGFGAGTTGIVYLDTGTGMYTLNTVDVGGGFAGGETIDNGAGVTAILTGGPYVILPDAFNWTSTDGGSGTLVPMDTSPIVLNDGVSITFGAVQGHTASDSWDWSYTVASGRMLALNGQGKQIMGDVDAIGNGTTFEIYDALSKFYFSNLYDGSGPDQFVTIDSSGALGATDASPSSPAGMDTQVQINNMGAFGATANFMYRISDDYFFIGDTNKVSFYGDSTGPVAKIYVGGTEMAHFGNAGQSFINDDTGNIDIDLVNRFLVDSSAANTIDWQNRVALGTNGTLKTFSWGDVDNLIWGDVDSSGNGTKLILDDSEGVLKMMHSSSVFGIDVSFFDARADFGILQSGHGLFIEGSVRTLNLELSGDSYLSLDANNFLYKFGDTASINNGTYISINDDLETISLLGGLVVKNQYATPTTGTTVTVAESTTVLTINPAGALLALTVAFPTGYDGRTVSFNCTQAVTTLTLSGGTFIGAPTTLGAGGFASFVYSSGDSKWHRQG